MNERPTSSASSAKRRSIDTNFDRLKRDRPRSALLRWSLVALAALAVASWASGEIEVDDLFEPRRLENLRRFLRVEITPFPLRDRSLDLGETISLVGAWAARLLRERGLQGALQTLAISVLAIGLAAFGAALLAPFAARNLATSDPFGPPAAPDRATSSALPRSPPADRRRHAWRALTTLVRAFLVLLRAIPEYVWAFLLLALLGPTAWPAVLALAIHNSGILGKLGAETVENLDAAPLRAIWWLGGRRAQIAVFAVAPLGLGRFLLYFFYRFETCVREATVLGLLGVASLGYWIQDARARNFYDEMIFFVALGAGIVLFADLTSAIARAILRRAS